MWQESPSSHFWICNLFPKIFNQEMKIEFQGYWNISRMVKKREHRKNYSYLIKIKKEKKILSLKVKIIENIYSCLLCVYAFKDYIRKIFLHKFKTIIHKNLFTVFINNYSELNFLLMTNFSDLCNWLLLFKSKYNY